MYVSQQPEDIIYLHPAMDHLHKLTDNLHSPAHPFQINPTHLTLHRNNTTKLVKDINAEQYNDKLSVQNTWQEQYSQALQM